MCHSAIKLSLKEERNHKPVNSDKTVSFTFDEKHDDCDDDGKRDLKDQVHVSEKGEDEFEVNIFQMNDFALRNSIATLTCDSEGFGDEFSGKSGFDSDGKLMKEPFGVFSEEKSEGLDEDESVQEFVALSDLLLCEVLGIHKLNKRSDKLWN
jgi:hypothetical protein